LNPVFTSANFVYNGDGKRVKSVMNMGTGSTTTYFVGSHYEVANGVVTKYYYAGSQRIALRTNGTLNYLLGDHFGSTSLTTDANGVVISELRYKAWGETRYASGTTPTKYQYTGQYSYTADFGLHFYNARWYDISLSRFAQADTIVPRGIQGYDRYAYTNNNPLRYTDPSGHFPIPLVIVLIGMAVILTADTPASLPPTNFPINANGGINCNSSLPDCFGDVVTLKDFSEYDENNPMPIEEFEKFADKVAEDLSTHELGWPGLSAGRGKYDTPFYNGGESERRTRDPNAEEGDYPANQQVCIETLGCYARSEINYIAQGMWGAAVGEPKPVSRLITEAWKAFKYRENKPSEGTYFWLEYGYDYYQQWEQRQQRLPGGSRLQQAQ
jgi:RHS repeat-associated protein